MQHDPSPKSASPSALAPEVHPSFSWRRLKEKKISYFTLPLILVATLVEVVILTTGWKYQQVACVPQGMGVLFLGIGPIGAVILSVELLKLPLAIWTASREGWHKWIMVIVGLPLICVLTFILVRDMAVYEMTKAMEPAQAMLAQANAGNAEIQELEKELANTKDDRQLVEEQTAQLHAGHKAELAALAQKLEKDKAELAAKKAAALQHRDDALARAEAKRLEAVTPTEYEKKELAECDTRQAAVVAQFATDTEQLTKAIAALRVARDAELARANQDSADWDARKKAYDAAYAKWFAEEARIDNAAQVAAAAHAKAKAEYERAKIEYYTANDLRRQFLKEPVAPAPAPAREVNAVTKPSPLEGRPSALVDALDLQIKAKEAELADANTKRRDRIAQIEADVRQLRQEIARRGGAKTDEADQKREAATAAYAVEVKELEAAEAALVSQYEARVKTAVQEVAVQEAKIAEQLKGRRSRDAVGKEIADKQAEVEELYKERVASLEKTQVYRIGTDVEMVRGLLLGEKPTSIRLSAKERGDLMTDLISMVRIWVYPVLAFIVAYLPTLMVEVGFSTLFEKPKKRQPDHRIGFLGRRLHALYKRAGRQKILAAERLAAEAGGAIAAREAQLQEARAQYAQELEAKEGQIVAAEFAKEEADAARVTELREQEQAWLAKYGGLADSLNRVTAEKDAMRDLQKAEIERQVLARQSAWSNRISQLQKDLDAAHAEQEAQRAASEQAHQEKLLEVAEAAKTQVAQARRQVADAELAHVEATAKLVYDLKEALRARDESETRLRQREQSHAATLARQKEEAAREAEKAVRQERNRFERLEAESAKALEAQAEEAARQLRQREQELLAQAEVRVGEAEARADQQARNREDAVAREIAQRVQDASQRLVQEARQQQEVALLQAKKREQQLLAQAEAARHEQRLEATQALQEREAELARATEARLREADARLAQELDRREEVFALKLQQREQELADAALAAARNAEAAFKKELLRQAEADQVRAQQREQEFAARLEARQIELRKQWEQEVRAAELDWERQTEARLHATEGRLQQEAVQKDELAQLKLRQREQQVLAQADARIAELQAKAEQDARRREIEQERAAEMRLREAEARFKQELRQREDAGASTLKQREQQLLAQAEAQVAELQARFAQEIRERDLEQERAAESRAKAAEARAQADARAQEEFFQSRLRQREQQLAMQADAKLAEAAREADVRLREAEGRFRQELQQREEAAQARAKQREQELATQLAGQFEARQAIVQAQWEADGQKRLAAQTEPLKAQLARVEKEREDAKLAAAAAAGQAQEWEKKLAEASSFLSGWKK